MFTLGCHVTKEKGEMVHKKVEKGTNKNWISFFWEIKKKHEIDAVHCGILTNFLTQYIEVHPNSFYPFWSNSH